MKLMIISDIHGSNYYLEKVLKRYKDENPDYLVILGDILYHGPRNPLPKGYEPKAVIEKLNQYKDKILCIKGNCDSEVDQMVLEFPIIGEYGFILFQGKKVFLSHGHKYNRDNIPLNDGDIMIQGHTHIPKAERCKGKFFLNPGSIALPKEGTPNSYGILVKETYSIKTLEGEIYTEIQIQ